MRSVCFSLLFLGVLAAGCYSASIDWADLDTRETHHVSLQAAQVFP